MNIYKYCFIILILILILIIYMNLEKIFHFKMVNLYNTAKKECGYNAVRFMQMTSEIGGLETAKQLILKENETYGFERLWELKRLDLSVETLILNPEFEDLFTIEERKICKNRLKKYGFNI